MPKASTRFRNRKINFKTRIGIRIGTLEAPSDHEDDDGFHIDEDNARQAASHATGSGGGDGSGRVETGVDKDEEREHHLQAVINASAAALSRHGIGLASTSGTSTKAGKARAPEPHIPIPDATGLVDPDAYETLYQREWPYALPFTYIRFSDTVEDALNDVAYVMDEDDEAWLEGFNAGNSSTSSAIVNGDASGHVNGAANGASEGRTSRRGSPRKGKEKEKARDDIKPSSMGKLEEDDFELLMDTFEKVTDETVPGLHLDTSRVPSLADFEPAWSEADPHSRLVLIQAFAPFVYAHWKERRLNRGGKPIMPPLDFDESNENNPYVCFRRREVKTTRKTRRTDAQNMDRLVRLRADLAAAKELLAKAVERERVKRELVEVEKAIFQGRCDVREMKRKLGEADGDEDLLVGKKEKRKKRPDGSLVDTGSPLKIPVRLRSSLPGGPASPTVIASELNALKERGAGLNRAMDREMHRRRDADSGWEDWTDSAYQPAPLSVPAKHWRATTAGGNEKDGPLSFETGPPVAIPGTVRPLFRRRAGRGGRILVDRIVPHVKRPSGHTQLITFASAHAAVAAATAQGRQDLPPAPTEEDDRRRRLDDRWKYDDDVRLDFAAVEDPAVIDDYSITYAKKRVQLLQPEDLVYLDTDSDAWLAKARAWLDRPPDPEPPVVKVGRLPGRPATQMAGPLAGLNGIGMGLGMAAGRVPAGSSAAMHDQMLLAAQHASGLSNIRRPPNPGQVQAGVRAGAGTPSAQQQPGQRTPGGGAVQYTPEQQRQLLAAMTWQQQQQQQHAAAQAQAQAQVQAAVQAQGGNMQAFPAIANQLVANQLLQQQYNQQLAAAAAAGAGGGGGAGGPGQNSLLAAARQQQHGHGMLPVGNATLARAQNAALNGMSPLANGLSAGGGRPTSAASSAHTVHGSPALQAQTVTQQLGSSPRPGSAASSHHFSPGTAHDNLPLGAGFPPGTFPNGSSPGLRQMKHPLASAVSPPPLVNGSSPPLTTSTTSSQQHNLQALQAALQAKSLAAAAAGLAANGLNGAYPTAPAGFGHAG